ncbi:ATP synthase subunit C lysine N-methyltransferase isoform X1 [Rissa tridactyla]|uniref:ATP synthase subunit C lysine N-methyltransferase isoform X1 n=1 Tax=Rissa tridactyla TaxID=75485 RepID=UPI0023BAE8E7|nr:ATP synthase subunit C lysine N-methyltransferase isoform X1 [Rissa tridactyla]XP_054045714.1 ATP synthase subunit C lysine N-methyltransferase isoform X1 [Rissa tridactyla]XP_054045715.1 ATP synthase subunit C lysine N-methyltransferase isoform X1 [Rissa tridactyla]XP_054045716.1 ATP synthase subunit C lysine N-methyltransferase isoform X1 [Rissa tridactyla]XP_054045717.1 ATP synthase subunit C lysine N-methyltransferase isoform X1 [Rissa tridactyla]
MSKVVVKENQPAGPQEVCEAGSRRSVWGLMVTAGVSGTLVALYAVVTPFVTPALRRVCLPFVPATSTQIQNVLKMLENRSGSLVDIGSGDGRIVIAAAKRGFKAVGYELNPWLVWYSRYRAWRDGVHQNTKFYISDLWKVSFSRYTNVVVFGVPQMSCPPEYEDQRPSAKQGGVCPFARGQSYACALAEPQLEQLKATVQHVSSKRGEPGCSPRGVFTWASASSGRIRFF